MGRPPSVVEDYREWERRLERYQAHEVTNEARNVFVVSFKWPKKSRNFVVGTKARMLTTQRIHQMKVAGDETDKLLRIPWH